MLVNCKFCNKSYTSENYLVKNNKTKFCSKSCKSKNAIIKNLGTPIERFFKNIKDENTSDCWLWKTYNHNDGYGTLHINRKRIYAHRYSWIIHYGEIPKGLFVCHKCDNPKCVNPEHLFLGTNTDNVNDMIKKGRKKQAKGNDYSRAKLKSEDVIDIRKMMKEGKKAIEIAKLYKITAQHVRIIYRKLNWAHID